eukprot:s112_g13.t4
MEHRSIACKAKLQSHELMLQQMASFECRAAECIIEAGRVLVEQQEALDAFNSYIRGPLRCAVMESVGDKLHVPYHICVVAALPMVFYSAVDILQCGEGCRSRYGLPSLEKGFLSEIFSWLTNSVLVFPIFFPVLLRMLKQAFTVQSQMLQLVLAALSGTCTKLIDALVYSMFQQGLISLMPFFVLLVILLLVQLRCLFGTGGAVTNGSADGTYRALHAADDFSIWRFTLCLYSKHLKFLHKTCHSRHAKLQERGEGGVGLMNQGATCYMNSLLQSLFYTPEFRLAVYGFEYDPDLHGEASRCIPLQLQKLFAELQMSVAGAASTKDLTTACGFTGRDAMQQHDVQELCRVLFDALERSSSLLADAIRGLYAGKSTSYIKCREEINGKVYQSARTEKYMDLQASARAPQDCSSLEEALRKLVEPEVMEGDNQWLCEELGKKVDALKGLTIESLPKILCIQLLRFVFDVATMRRKKLSEVVALPLILDLAFLSDSGIGPSSYQLAAVCLHSGTAHGGHYHAFAWDPCSGAWRDANDTRVQVLSAKQCSALFGAADDAQPQALHSADAYFLLYRRVSQTEVPSVQDAAIPQCLRDALLSENQNLSRLQRAYDLHRKLLEVEVFLPLAAERALQRYAATQLEALGAAAPEAEPEMSVTVKTSSQRPAAAVQRKVLKSLASSDMSWCRDVDLAALKSARLRLYDPWRGLPGRLLEGSALGDCLGGGFNSTATLVMELPDASGCFEQWQEDRTVTFLVLWDRQLGAPSLGSGSVVALRLPPAEEACAAGEANLAKEPTQVPPSTETYEPETEEVQQDLFALEVPAEPARSHGDRSPLLRTVREAAATLWNLPASSYLALVPLSGMQAGKELKGDDLTLQGSGCEYGDIICVEQLEGPGVSQAVQLVEEKCNTAKIYFNHPTRPQFTEEFPPMAISKDAPIFELKARIAQALQLDASTLHLCRSQHAPAMFKDESRTLRQAGLSEASSIFVGDGAPCSPEECLLKVLLYTYDKGNHKARELFSLAARGDSSVRNLREAVYEPLLRWAKEEDPEAIGFDPVAVTGWKKLRLRFCGLSADLVFSAPQQPLIPGTRPMASADVVTCPPPPPPATIEAGPVAPPPPPASVDVNAVRWHGWAGASSSWEAPRVAAQSDSEARPGYAAYDASEYLDEPAVLQEKVRMLAEMWRRSGADTVIYTGAGLSTASGIGDYASKASSSVAPHKKIASTGSRLELSPTFAHHALAAVAEKGLIGNWVQQNHDRLAQKAGFPQAKLNEIHGAWGDSKNQVKMMDDTLRHDLLQWLLSWSLRARLCVSLGTSLCGMTSDEIPNAVAERYTQGEGEGLVIIGLQRTFYDERASLRIWGLCDEVMSLLAKELRCKVPDPKVARRGEEWVSKHPRLTYNTPTRTEVGVDGQAGKQFAILRDERTLRSALLGFGDGRQVAVQVMAEDEDLGPDDLVILVRPWRVREARLHASTEIVATRNQSLAKFQDMLAERFKGLLHAEEEKDNVVPVKSTDEISQDGKEHIAPVASGKPTAETFKDSLEIVAAHNTGPPLTSKRCETLKWADSRLTPGPQTVEKPLADFKEVRDGVTLVIRSRLAALAGVEVSEPAAGPSKGGKKGVAKASAKAALKAKGGDSTVTVSTGRAERGLIIQVAHPETEAEEAAPVSPNAI